MNQPIRVLVADDQRVVREGLALVLGLLPEVEVVGAAADGDEAVAMAAELLPDIVLMDLRMPRCDGVEATRLLRDRAPGTMVVILTTYADDRSVLDALRAGARGYLTKDAGGEDIRRALKQVLVNRAVIDPAVQHHVVDAIATLSSPAQADRSPCPLPAGLTPREAEVLALIAAGLSNREIAARLVLAEGTVKSHVNHLLAKIDARDRAQAVSYAYRRGLASPGKATSAYSAAVCAATASQENSSTARSRPARPIASARPGSRSSTFIASASDAGSSGGTSSPVTPPSTTSGMPPTRDATTAVEQAIASRLTMPSGSYTDGQTNTSACVSSWMTVRLGQHLRDPDHPGPRRLQPGHQRGHLGAELGRVRRPGAQHELRRRVERGRRPQQHGHALLPGDPADEDHVRPGRVDAVLRQHVVSGSGAYSAVSMPFRITRTRSGEISG